MAIRSGAGTGVIVSLVVFILTTVFMLVLSIVFYAGKADAIQAASKAQDDLAQYVSRQQASTDRFKTIEEAAKANGQSVAAYLLGRHDDLMRYVNGDATIGLDQLKAVLAGFGVADTGVVLETLKDMRRAVRQGDEQKTGLERRLRERDDELAQKQAEIDRMRDDHARALEDASQEIVSYREAGERYRDDIQRTKDEMNLAADRMQDDYESRIENLEDELDGSNQQLVLLRSRMKEYESVLNEIRIRGKDPAMLVDGGVIDVDSSNDQVFIDRGKKDRVVLGMTFEVYDDAASIRVNEHTGTLPRGKASLQVTRVGPTTSTCKLTRTIPGRPVVRNDVIANAIYDPQYRFKFLVHGKFDIDADGRASEAEADYLRSVIEKWGGEVVYGEELPGDLDFLVLGETPSMPGPLPPDANQVQIDIWVRRRNARMQYEEMFQRASEAQIPVLNSNRFFILIGHTDR